MWELHYRIMASYAKLSFKKLHDFCRELSAKFKLRKINTGTRCSWSAFHGIRQKIFPSKHLQSWLVSYQNYPEFFPFDMSSRPVIVQQLEEQYQNKNKRTYANKISKFLATFSTRLQKLWYSVCAERHHKKQTCVIGIYTWPVKRSSRDCIIESSNRPTLQAVIKIQFFVFSEDILYPLQQPSQA